MPSCVLRLCDPAHVVLRTASRYFTEDMRLKALQFLDQMIVSAWVRGSQATGQRALCLAGTTVLACGQTNFVEPCLSCPHYDGQYPLTRMGSSSKGLSSQGRGNDQRAEFLNSLQGIWSGFDSRVLRFKVSLQPPLPCNHRPSL